LINLRFKKIQKQEISLLKKGFKSIHLSYKKIDEIVDKGTKEFYNFVTAGRQNPKLGTVYNIYADFLTKSSEVRKVSISQFSAIWEEWKSLSKKDFKNVESKLDAACKALVARQHYESSKDETQARDFDQKYNAAIYEYVKLLHELRERKESSHPAFVLRSLQSELLLVKNLLKEAENCEASIRQLGPVESIKFEGFTLLAREPYPMSEDDKKKSKEASSNPYGGSPAATTTTSTSDPYGGHQQPAPQHNPYGAAVPAPVPVQPVLPVPVARFPQCQALYPFNASSPQELSFNVGDVLNLLNVEGQWWRAELNGREGMIPSNYVQRI